MCISYVVCISYVLQCLDSGDLDLLSHVLTTNSMHDLRTMVQKSVSLNIIREYSLQRVSIPTPSFTICSKQYITESFELYGYILRRAMTRRHFNVVDMQMVRCYIENKMIRDIVSGYVILPPKNG